MWNEDLLLSYENLFSLRQTKEVGRLWCFHQQSCYFFSFLRKQSDNFAAALSPKSFFFWCPCKGLGETDVGRATSKFISNPRGRSSDLSTATTADGKGELVIYPAESVQDRAGNETKVTRRDETRDGLVQFVSRPKLTRRDEVRDQVHEEQNFTQDFYPNFDILDTFFSSRRSRETMSRDETRSRRSRLVSRFFEAGPSRYRP